jgi:serine/threonine protein phosphatase PrpC
LETNAIDWSLRKSNKDWKASLVIVEPDIASMTVSDSDEFLLLATDGLFHGMNSTETMDVARRELLALRGDPKEAARRLSDHATQTPIYSQYSGDNISIIIVVLRPFWDDVQPTAYRTEEVANPFTSTRIRMLETESYEYEYTPPHTTHS